MLQGVDLADWVMDVPGACATLNLGVALALTLSWFESHLVRHLAHLVFRPAGFLS